MYASHTSSGEIFVKVAVFGAAGWLGRAVLTHLEDHGHQVRAIDYGEAAWKTWEDVDGKYDGDIVHADIADYDQVIAALEGQEAIVHTAVFFPSGDPVEARIDNRPFLINLKGLWNVLEGARLAAMQRVVHIGSCQTVHPQGDFFTADVRRPDGSLYAVTKRLQEEMCRQYWDAFQLPLVVLRPDYIVDTRIGLGRQRETLGADGHEAGNGWVCRHDLAEACCLAINSDIGFDVFHIVGTPEATQTCTVERSRAVLGLKYEGDLEKYR
jgi:nucleoside-diphosphate-sugar epimerase